MFRKNIIETIENHLCFVFASNKSTDYEEQAEAVCIQTFAYSLGSEDERILLVKIFTAITEKIVLQTDDEQLQNLHARW